MAENTATLISNFNFRVKLRQSAQAAEGDAGTAGSPDASGQGDLLSEGGFQSCTGLDIQMDVQELQEGGRNDGVIRRVGRGKYSDIVLKRGMFIDSGSGTANEAIWSWLQSILTGARPVTRYDGVIEVLDNRGDSGGHVVATWTFARGLPAKVSGPQLDAKSGDISIEELTISHEGLQLVTSGASGGGALGAGINLSASFGASLRLG